MQKRQEARWTGRLSSLARPALSTPALTLLLNLIYTVKKPGGGFKKICKISILPAAECFLGKH